MAKPTDHGYVIYRYIHYQEKGVKGHSSYTFNAISNLIYGNESQKKIENNNELLKNLIREYKEGVKNFKDKTFLCLLKNII